MREQGQQPSEHLIEQLAQQINRWQLAEPAVLFLEVTKPLSFIASQGLLLCEPLISSFLAEARIADYAGLLADRSNLEQLIACLEGNGPVQDSDDEEGERWT